MADEKTDAPDAPNYESIYQEFWVPLLEVDGVLNIDQMRRELFDYHSLLRNVNHVYWTLTNGVISNPQTAPQHVITYAEAARRVAIDDALAEDRSRREVSDGS